ncbi:MAG: hypothetical protein KDC87_10405 [Planctomycetes bacterium]|nr:hypothetical protein [Planctomycetota bacterium]MCB9869461.1 hypothetical protein [Planctomycetota bacterium]
MTKTIRIALPLALSVMPWAACSGPRGNERLAPAELPEWSGGTRGPGAADGTPRPAPGAAAARPEVFPPVPEAAVAQADLLPFLRERSQKAGEAGLRGVQPGLTLVERLRYCWARVELRESDAVRPELERLERAHPSNPAVWVVLVRYHELNDRADAAIAAARRVVELERPTGFARFPEAPTTLGRMLLRTTATRDEGRRLLHQLVLEAKDPVDAAIDLANDYLIEEENAQVEAVLVRARERAPDSKELIRGLAAHCVRMFEPKRAIELLGPLAQQPPTDPAVEYQLTQAMFLAGDYAGTLKHVEVLLGRTDRSPDERAELVELREWALDAKRAGKQLWRLWECLAILRGHPSLDLRCQVLAKLSQDKSPVVAERALFVADRTGCTPLRVLALVCRLRRVKDPMPELEAGLRDRQHEVRAKAAELLPKVWGQLADRQSRVAMLSDLVLGCMAAEQNSYAFRMMHHAMQALSGREVPLPFGACADPAQRREIVTAWRNGR